MTLKAALKVISEAKYILSPSKDGAYLDTIRIDYLTKGPDFTRAISQRDAYAAMKTRVSWIHFNRAADCIEISFDIL